MYALYNKGRTGGTGTSSGGPHESGEMEMEEGDNYEGEEGMGEEDEGGNELRLNGEGPESPEGDPGRDMEGGDCMGQENGRELPQEVEVGVQEAEGGEEVREIEAMEQEGWPRWLKAAVEMLSEGKRGVEMETMIRKMVMIEKPLGFKGEKTVRINFNYRELSTDYSTPTGGCQRQAEDSPVPQTSGGVHGLSQKAGALS